jgi:hypothetical protein
MPRLPCFDDSDIRAFPSPEMIAIYAPPPAGLVTPQVKARLELLSGAGSAMFPFFSPAPVAETGFRVNVSYSRPASAFRPDGNTPGASSVLARPAVSAFG